MYTSKWLVTFLDLSTVKSKTRWNTSVVVSSEVHQTLASSSFSHLAQWWRHQMFISLFMLLFCTLFTSYFFIWDATRCSKNKKNFIHSSDRITIKLANYFKIVASLNKTYLCSLVFRTNVSLSINFFDLFWFMQIFLNLFSNSNLIYFIS